MGRHPIGDQAMTVAERQRRYLAKLVASARPAPTSELVVNRTRPPHGCASGLATVPLSHCVMR